MSTPTKSPKRFTGNAKIVGPLNRMLDCIEDRTPIAGDNIRISYEKGRFRIHGTPGGGKGVTLKRAVITAVYGNYIECADFTADANGIPSSISGDTFYVAKDWAMQYRSWHNHSPSPYGTIQHDSIDYLFIAAASGGVTAEQGQFRKVYQRSGFNPSWLLREEYVWPPYVPGQFTGVGAFEGSIIVYADVGETLLVVGSTDVTKIDLTQRTWVPKASMPREFSILSVTGAGISAKPLDPDGNVAGTATTIQLPRIFRPTSGTTTDGDVTYTYTGFGERIGRTTGAVSTTEQAQEWYEVITPAYAAGQIITAVPLPGGSYIDVASGRAWAQRVDSNWYCTQTERTQITGRFTGPYQPE